MVRRGSYYLAVVVGAAIIPLFLKHPYYLHILIVVFIFSIASLGVRLVISIGEWNFGQGAFMTLGLYTSALLVLKGGLSSWLALPIAGLVAALLGLILGYPALRLKGAYFGILTMSLTAAARQVIAITPETTGGLPGIYNIRLPDAIRVLGLTLEFTSKVSLYYYALALFALALLVMYRLEHSRIGGVFRAIRESDTLAQSVGIDIAKYKVLAFVVSCFFAGLAGAFSAHYFQLVHADLYGLWQSIYFVAYAIVGGVGAVVGSIIGTLVLVFAVEFLRAVRAYQVVAFGLLLLVTIMFLPGGIIDLPRVALAWLARFRTESRPSSEEKNDANTRSTGVN